VVGNPPWVRAERLPRAARERLAERYRWWRGTGRGGFAHRPDLAVAFVERGLELAAPGGVLAMLLPAKLATSGYATAARAALARQHTLDVVADLTTQDEDPFGAVTYPLALVARKRGADPGHQVALDLGGRRHVPQEGWGAAPWVLSAPAAARVAERLLATHPPLSELVRIHLGVKSGQNAVYLDPPDGVEPDLLRLAIRGRDIAPFGVRRGARFLWPHDAAGAPLPTLPPGAAAHLAHHRDLLARRADAGRGPWYALHRTRPACAAHRVAWADLARRLTATVLPPRVIPLNSCYLALTRTAESALGLAAFLNSTWADALARLGADPARGGYARYNARAVGRVPCPAALLDDPALVDLAQRQAAGARLEGTLDALVADRLALDARDREALRASR
jgi:hypothetical protein